MFPDEGPLRRELYPKHIEFMANGAISNERLFMAANRVGKTMAGGYEAAVHLTGKYPHWWTGKRFEKPVRAWAAGKTNETTRDIIQQKMFGDVIQQAQRKVFTGTGLVPGDDIVDTTWRQGINNYADTIRVRHVTGGDSIIRLKSYEQGRGSFEGTEQDFIWLDEEPKLDVYIECLVRTMTTGGMVYITFTPLEGMSDVVLSFLQATSNDMGFKEAT